MKLLAMASALLGVIVQAAVAETAAVPQSLATTEAAGADEDRIRRKDRPEMAQVRQAVQAFRLITATAGLRPGAASD